MFSVLSRNTMHLPVFENAPGAGRARFLRKRLYKVRNVICTRRWPLWLCSFLLIGLVFVLAPRVIRSGASLWEAPNLLHTTVGCPFMFLESNLTLTLNQSLKAPNVSKTMFLAAIEMREQDQGYIAGIFRVRHPFAPHRTYNPSKDDWDISMVANSTLAAVNFTANRLDQIQGGSARQLRLGSEQMHAVYSYGPEDPRIIRCGMRTLALFHQPDIRMFAPMHQRFQYILDIERNELYWIDEPRALTHAGRDSPLVDKNYVPLCVNGDDLYIVTSFEPLRVLGPCTLRKDQVFAQGVHATAHRAHCPEAFNAFNTSNTFFRDSQIFRGSTQFEEIIPGRAYVSLVHARRCGIYDRCSYQAAIAVLVHLSSREWKAVYYPSLLKLYVPGGREKERPRSGRRREHRCLLEQSRHAHQPYRLHVNLVENPASIIRFEKDESALVSLNVNDEETLIVRIPELYRYASSLARCILEERAEPLLPRISTLWKCSNGAVYATQENAVNSWHKIDPSTVARFQG